MYARLIASVLLLGADAFGCLCFSTPVCQQVGAYTESDVVFVGRVTNVWPSRQTIASTTDGSVSSSFGTLQRVELAVSDVFSGPRVEEIFTDASSCGFAFEVDKSYLVVGRRVDGLYRTFACSRTGLVDSDEAREGLKALRAWKAGRPLGRRIYGRIDSSQLRPETRVTLRGRGREELLTIDSQGRFSAEELTRGTYRIRVADERGSGERVVDLQKNVCSEASAKFHDGRWEVGAP